MLASLTRKPLVCDRISESGGTPGRSPNGDMAIEDEDDVIMEDDIIMCDVIICDVIVEAMGDVTLSGGGAGEGRGGRG